VSAPVTTDLLAVWTDPDTAMEAVGTNLGIFDDRVASPSKVLAADERLRNTLFDVLLSLVEGGALEMRPCGGGRHAFRWRDDFASPNANRNGTNGNAANGLAAPPVEAKPPWPTTAPVTEAPLTPPPVEATQPPEPAPVTEAPLTPPPVEAAPAPEPPPQAPPVVVAVPLPGADADTPDVAQISAPTPQPGASRPILQAPLLVVPAVSALLAVLCYLWLATGLAIAVIAVMLVAGIVGLVRRVPFAGAWVVGIVAAGLLLRFS